MSKRGSKVLRYALVNAAHNVVKNNATFKAYYDTNMIESYNKQLKRHFKSKEQFPTEQSEEKYLVLQFERYNEKFLNRIHKGFGKVTDF